MRFYRSSSRLFSIAFNFAMYVFQQQRDVSKNYGHADVLGMSQWAKQVGREKHRMEAFVRLKNVRMVCL